MTTLVARLYHDDAGFIVSAELTLVSTILVLGMLVGLSEVAHGVVQELEDVGSAFGALNQSYCYSGLTGHKGQTFGGKFNDNVDECDSECDISCDGPIGREDSGWSHD